MEEMGVGRLGEDESIGEDVLAIVECNNCFADGVQVATGCTFGNNALIYHDLGKNALILVRRGDWEGVRVYIDAEKVTKKYFPKEAEELFKKVVTRREGDEEDRKLLSQLWEEIGYKMLEIPKEDFKIEKVKVVKIDQAPIFESVRCSSCGELAMKTRVIIDEEPYCLKCAKRSYRAVVGEGIVEVDSWG